MRNANMRSLLGVLALLTLGGCAGPTPLETEGVAKSGRQYVNTLKKVNEFALDHTLEFTADLLPNLPRNETTLQQQTSAMRQRVELLNNVAAYFDAQLMYFAELDALAKGDNSTGTARALRKFVEALNKAPDSPGITRVTKTAVSGLAGQVAQWKHSKAMAQVLERDADTVGQALLMNQYILEEQIQWITQREELARQVEYREKVLKPYVGSNKLPEAWKKAWIADIKRSPFIELLAQAKAASVDMQQAWVNVLRGQGSFEHLRGTFAQINENIQAASDTMAGEQ